MNKAILSDNDIDSIHPIQVVVRRTGLSADVIRAWERRYDAVTPKRSSTSRRLYSDEDVERLLLLRRATQSGRRIGDVARLPLPALKDLLATAFYAGIFYWGIDQVNVQRTLSAPNLKQARWGAMFAVFLKMFPKER